MSDAELDAHLSERPVTKAGAGGCMVRIKFHPECDPSDCDETWEQEEWLLTAEHAALFVINTLNGWCVDNDFLIEVNGVRIWT